jgi:hypothetical protein
MDVFGVGVGILCAHSFGVSRWSHEMKVLNSWKDREGLDEQELGMAALYLLHR